MKAERLQCFHQKNKHNNLIMRQLQAVFLFLFFNLLWSCTPTEINKTVPVENKIIVGVYSGNGASPICILETLEALKIDTGIAGIKITPADIMLGKLDSIDVLIFPGGSGSKELNSLGDLGKEKVIDFVQNQGKGIVGICAGGYLLSKTPTYPSLQLIDAKNIDRKHYSRGRGLVEIKITGDGEKIFPELKGKRAFLQYYDGPVLEPTDSNNIKFTEIAKYVTDIHANKGIPSGITPEKTFLLFEQIGNGHIFVSAGHPESTPGMRWMVPRMARYVYSQKIIEYPQKWIRPEINDSAIMFTADVKKYEKKLFWQLLNDTPQVRINAMIALHSLRSRPAVRWTIGLLRDKNPEVRKQAAAILKETEYTYALQDILAALKIEKNPEVKKQLQETANFLSEF